METVLTWVGFLVAVGVGLCVAAATIDHAWKRVWAGTRLAFCYLVTGPRNFSRLRSFVGKVHQERKEWQDNHDHLVARAYWYEAMLYENDIFPDHKPSEMSRDEAEARRVAAMDAYMERQREAERHTPDGALPRCDRTSDFDGRPCVRHAGHHSDCRSANDPLMQPTGKAWSPDCYLCRNEHPEFVDSPCFRDGKWVHVTRWTGENATAACQDPPPSPS